ncbi:apolipoprotein N-acyltransferase [Amycolatopsis tucumanensis]|uniref:apolipoprotein N-acyltransferase n=1 Tax=Amycolatopsis tucumanensis TaxID=401106 RepID=UPI003D70CE4F
MRYPYLIGGCVLSVFAINARWDIALAAWLCNVLLLRFTRQSRWWVAWLWAWLVMTLDVGVWLWHADLTSPVFVPIAAALGLGCSLPFLADRLAAPRLGTLPATLVFPLAKVTVEYLVSTAAPVGGIVGVLGVTQHGNLPLAQLASVTGVYGVSFLVAWFAPVALACWEHRRRWRTAVVTFAGVLAVVLAAGGIRLIAAAPGGETVRVAGVAPAPQAWQRTLDGIAPYESVEAMSQADPAVLQEAFGHVVDDLLARSAREAGAGAKLVVWPESAVVTMDRDEQALLTRFGEFARQHGIHLSAGLTVYTGSAPFVRNESVLFAPDGSVRWTYRKAHPIPVLEPYEAGDGVVPVADTPLGRLATVICFDANFPSLLRQGGDQRVDLMLVPSNDWNGIKDGQARTARLRAIENGFAVVRPTMEGLSEAVDPLGRVLASTDYFHGGQDPTMVAYVPTHGTRTIYGTIGDVFAWLCLAALAGLIVTAARRT